MIAAGYFLVKLEFSELWAVLKAYLSVLTHLKTIIRSRKELKETIQPGYHPEIYEKSIVYKFFLKGVKTYSDLIP